MLAAETTRTPPSASRRPSCAASFGPARQRTVPSGGKATSGPVKRPVFRLERLRRVQSRQAGTPPEQPERAQRDALAHTPSGARDQAGDAGPCPIAGSRSMDRGSARTLGPRRHGGTNDRDRAHDLPRQAPVQHGPDADPAQAHQLRSRRVAAASSRTARRRSPGVHPPPGAFSVLQDGWLSRRDSAVHPDLRSEQGRRRAYAPTRSPGGGTAGRGKGEPTRDLRSHQDLEVVATHDTREPRQIREGSSHAIPSIEPHQHARCGKLRRREVRDTARRTASPALPWPAPRKVPSH